MCKAKYHCEKEVWTVNRLACGLLGIDDDSFPSNAATNDSGAPRPEKRAKTNNETRRSSPRLQQRRNAEVEHEATAGSEVETVTVTRPHSQLSDNAADEFVQLARKASRFFRIRHFVRKTPEDRYGRNCSQWCAENSYCASIDCVLKWAPVKISTGRGATEYLRGSHIDVIKDHNRRSGRYAENERGLSTYCSSYKRFACMEKGDIIAMLVPGPTGKGEAYFGVITSDNLILMTPDEAEEKEFPAPVLFEEGYSEGLLLRDVRWMRKGYVRDLPVQKEGKPGVYSVSWLAESGPFWLVEPSKGKPLDIITGTDTSADFLNATTRL
ncbi:hypothetical protein ACHAWF_001014 [Thalassiosira exigua]